MKTLTGKGYANAAGDPYIVLVPDDAVSLNDPRGRRVTPPDFYRRRRQGGVDWLEGYAAAVKDLAEAERAQRPDMLGETLSKGDRRLLKDLDEGEGDGV